MFLNKTGGRLFGLDPWEGSGVASKRVEWGGRWPNVAIIDLIMSDGRKNRHQVKSSTVRLTNKPNMAVMTSSPKKAKGQHATSKKGSNKQIDKTRPITATLDHPLILDIKLLQKLDMTTFTKKGLIALSKFCGISLINNGDSKRKLNKSIKTIQHTKKPTGGTEIGISHKVQNFEATTKRTRKKLGKQNQKLKPRIRFKATDSEEDSKDVVCGRHEPPRSQPAKDGSSSERKAMIDDLINNSMGTLVPEPCKSCSRSEHPERLHSHPKVPIKLAGKSGRSLEERSLEERFKNSVTTKDSEDLAKGRKTPSAKSFDFGPSQKFSSGDDRKRNPSTDKSRNGTPIKNSDDFRLSPKTESTKKLRTTKKPVSLSDSKSNGDAQLQRKESVGMNSDKRESECSEESSAVPKPDEDAIRFLTGCYICGKQVPPSLRMQHEEGCIEEWKTQNSLLPPDERKPEPKRPDFRFTASGDLDPQGTFDSIWANHKDSLVPCKKCGRRFFPDRVQRHENCCNLSPHSLKNKR